jgi:hypothetical protein
MKKKESISWLYKWRLLKHAMLWLITMDIDHAYEAEHYFYSKTPIKKP